MFKTEYNRKCKWHMSITDKEVMNMPGKDGTGVMGHGAKSGRGNCTGANAVRKGTGSGLGLGQGYRRGLPNFDADATVAETQKELLQEQKKLLERKLDSISKQLESVQ